VKRNPPIDNAAIAELLAQEAQKAKHPLNRAFRRAARAAFLWPEEAWDIADRNESLTILPSVGPYLEKTILAWLEKPPSPGVVPEIRKNFLTMAKASRILTENPSWRSVARGDLQMHTEWSDGENTIAEMAEAGRARGYEYIAITDHAKSLKIAGGIDEAALSEQAAEIQRVNQTSLAHGNNFRVLRSIELNLSPAGQGDMPPEALRQLDVVIGAFHSALRRTDDQTERYLAAVRNPGVHILAHPRTRIYNHRLGLAADWPEVFAAAAALDKAVEVDCYPDRQDLDGKTLRLAKAAGVKVSLGTDSHHSWQLEFMTLGLAAACAAGIARKNIVNNMSADALLAWVEMLRAKQR